MVTTADSVDRAVAAMHQGAHDFIVKPVGATKLVEAVRKAVHRVSAERRVGRPDITLPRLRSEAMDVSWPDPAGRSPRTAQDAAAMDGDLAAVRPLWMVERETIETAIAQCRGNISRAAGLLEISASTIYRKRLAWEARERGRKSTT
ncbi:MAG: hypothetical protein HKM95_02655 [Inquilinus sp.]|nr:hypothetical protein [Inquilinus sp.]